MCRLPTTPPGQRADRGTVHRAAGRAGGVQPNFASIVWRWPSEMRRITNNLGLKLLALAWPCSRSTFTFISTIRPRSRCGALRVRNLQST
jgi:hypothetical protein